jgi:hypothetical protein
MRAAAVADNTATPMIAAATTMMSPRMTIKAQSGDIRCRPTVNNDG